MVKSALTVRLGDRSSHPAIGFVNYFIFYYFYILIMADSSDKTCSGCLAPITDRRFLNCSVCKKHYDIVCANVSETRFYTTMSKEHKAKWKCVECLSSQPKLDNSETPVRSTDGVTMHRGSKTYYKGQDIDDSINVSMQHMDACHDKSLELTSVQELIVEIRLFRQELAATRVEVQALNVNIANLANRVEACEGHVKELDGRMSALEQRFDAGASVGTSDTLLTAVDDLKAQLNERNQELLSNDVEVSCVPVAQTDR